MPVDIHKRYTQLAKDEDYHSRLLNSGRIPPEMFRARKESLTRNTDASIGWDTTYRINNRFEKE
jgi:hypothetical protein